MFRSGTVKPGDPRFPRHDVDLRLENDVPHPRHPYFCDQLWDSPSTPFAVALLTTAFRRTWESMKPAAL